MGDRVSQPFVGSQWLSLAPQTMLFTTCTLCLTIREPPWAATIPPTAGAQRQASGTSSMTPGEPGFGPCLSMASRGLPRDQG